MARKRGSGRRTNGSSSSPNAPPPPPPLTRLPPALTKSAPPVAGLFDPPSLDAEGKPSMAIGDFRGFAWSDDKINAVLDYSELRADSMAQDPHDAHNTHDKRLKHRIALNKHIKKIGLRDGKTSGPTKRTEGPRDCIFIEGSDSKLHHFYFQRTHTNDRPPEWVLFDPLKGYAQDSESEPPPTQYAKYEIYKPGNRKIIVFNLNSSAVTLKTTPVEFIGYDVDYLPNGPKLIKEGEKKAVRTQLVRKTRGKGKGKASQSSTESPQDKENEVFEQKETPTKKVAPKMKEAVRQKTASKKKEAPKKKEALKVKEALEKEVAKVEEASQVEESPKAEKVSEESKALEQKEKTPPPPTRRSPRTRKRASEAEEAEAEVEAPPKRRKVAVPKKKT